jgi:charged multivesicular body protein 6
VLDREQQIAKEQLAAGRKDRALLALRRRKYQQGLLERTDGQLQNLEELVSIILSRLRYIYLNHSTGLHNRVLTR